MTDLRLSKSDSRKARYIKLDNGLKCILVSDPESTKGAAALSVHIGAAMDPKDRPGLAHFLEHMLFMGTEKYPNENEYSEFISQNGGYDNAYTSFT